MPAKMIVILMMVTLVILFISFKKIRKSEVAREKLEVEEFEALQKKEDL
jgi:CHASE3 domain sensor protein